MLLVYEFGNCIKKYISYTVPGLNVLKQIIFEKNFFKKNLFRFILFKTRLIKTRLITTSFIVACCLIFNQEAQALYIITPTKSSTKKCTNQQYFDNELLLLEYLGTYILSELDKFIVKWDAIQKIQKTFMFDFKNIKQIDVIIELYKCLSNVYSYEYINAYKKVASYAYLDAYSENTCISNLQYSNKIKKTLYDFIDDSIKELQKSEADGFLLKLEAQYALEFYEKFKFEKSKLKKSKFEKSGLKSLKTRKLKFGTNAKYSKKIDFMKGDICIYDFKIENSINYEQFKVEINKKFQHILKYQDTLHHYYHYLQKYKLRYKVKCFWGNFVYLRMLHKIYNQFHMAYWYLEPLQK